MRKNIIRISAFFVIFIIMGIVFFKIVLPTRYGKNKTVNSEKSEILGKKEIPGHSLTPVISNQWYSSLYSGNPTQPLYAFPLAYKITDEGLGFSYPAIKRTPNTIFAPYTTDFTVGLTEKVLKPKITAVGDWSIGLSLATNKEENMSFTLAHGIPYTHIHTNAKSFTIKLPNGFTLLNEGKTKTTDKTLTTREFQIDTNNNSYIFVLPKDILVNIQKNSLTLSGNDLFVGLLDSKEHYKNFKEISSIELLETKSTPVISENKINTTYAVSTNNIVPLVALLPHQSDFTNANTESLGTYETIRGTLNLIKSTTFTTSIPQITPADTYIRVSKNEADIKKQIAKDIDAVLKESEPASRDYTLGSWFGKIDNLIQLADTYEMANEKNKLINYLEPKFYESLNHFHYDDNKTSLIADQPEYGNEKLNDHHFHYGYYIRTAAVLAKQSPASLEKSKTVIQQMIDDIATTDRSSEKFPYLRNFDIYEGHSWADGYANFADGNNQESSSEAIQAWYSVYLWGKTINDEKLTNTALYLYNTEIQSAYYYWFDVKNIYKSPYAHRLGSIIWGGKVDFATWFSDKTNMKYGIQLLPFTPGSMYLANLPDFKPYEADFHSSGGRESDEWGDLFLMWESFYDPGKIQKSIERVKKFERNNTKSLFMYIIDLNLK